jgi:hypothetical protein
VGLVPRENKASKELEVLMGNQASKGREDRKELLGRQDHRDSLGNQDLWDPKEPEENKVLLESQA